MPNYNLNEHEQDQVERPTHVVELDKASNQTLRWVQKATANKSDNRPILQGVYVDGAILAADGFRIHAAPRPHMVSDELEGKILDFGKIPARAEQVEAEEVEGRWPDYSVIVPRDEPDFEIWCNAQYLIDALRGMTNGIKRVRIAVHNQTSLNGGTIQIIEVHGEGPDGQAAYALVMGMLNTREPHGVYDWRPTDKAEIEEE